MSIGRKNIPRNMPPRSRDQVITQARATSLSRRLADGAPPARSRSGIPPCADLNGLLDLELTRKAVIAWIGVRGSGVQSPGGLTPPSDTGNILHRCGDSETCKARGAHPPRPRRGVGNRW